MKQILCLSNEPWSNRLPGRTQQLISRLRDAQILYFFPAQSPRDKSFLKQGRQVRPNVTACALPPIPFPLSARPRPLARQSCGGRGSGFPGEFLNFSAARPPRARSLARSPWPRVLPYVLGQAALQPRSGFRDSQATPLWSWELQWS